MVHRRGFLGRSVLLAGGWSLFSNTWAQVLNINDAINKSGRQRMLSQRMAKFYQAQQWGVAPADAAGKLEQARKEFVAAMQTLSDAPGDTARIHDELTLAQQQWLFFDAALHQNGDSMNRQRNATNVATTSERILEVMDGVTGLYQQLA